MSELPETMRVTLAQGVSSGAVAQLRQLLAQISGFDASAEAGLDDGGDPPIIAPAMLLGDPAIADQTMERIPPEGLAVLHEAQTFRKLADAIPANFRVIDIACQKRPTSVIFDFRVFHDEQCLAEMRTRLQFVTPEQIRAMRGTQFSDRLNAPDATWTRTADMTPELVGAYLELAHDPNPIHHDDGAAQAAGFGGAVVPGMLLCGLAEVALVAALPDVRIREMKVRFLAAVAVGENLALGVIPKGRTEGGQVSGARVFAVTQSEQIALIADIQLWP